MYIGYFNSVLSDKGVPIVATITIYVLGTNEKAVIYSDPAGTAQKDNPFQTDALSRFMFYAPAGRYDLEVSGAGVTNYKIENVFIDFPYHLMEVVCDNGDVVTDEGEIIFLI